MPYFDYNATAPIAPEARQEWLRLTDESWANPSSPYRPAVRAKLKLESIREQLGQFLGAPSEQLVFNSGATEGAHAIFEYLARILPADTSVLANPTEHPALLGALERYFWGRVDWLNVTPDGRLSLDEVDRLIAKRKPGAVVAMAANNETGVIQPWEKIARLCRKAGVTYVCDATQWMGKLPGSGFGAVDWVIASGHKFGGPKGVGFLKIAPKQLGFRCLPGGEQEHGHRGGTENLPAVGAMIRALADAEQTQMIFETERIRWREHFALALNQALPEVQLVAATSERLWNTVSLILPYGENHRWVLKLDQRGFQVSTGSACATAKEGPSHVLKSMGIAADDARRVIRISSGWTTTEEDWRGLLNGLMAVSKEVMPSDNVVRL